MNRKILAIVAMSLAVLLVAAVLVVTLGGNGGGTTIELTPTPAPQVTPMPTPDPAVPLISAEAFQNPGMSYRGLKMLHSISSQVGSTNEKKAEALLNSGFGGVVTNIRWTSSYPFDDEGFAQLNDFVQALNEKGVRVWIYDEYAYPSGAAYRATANDGYEQYQSIGLGQYSVSGSGSGTQEVDVPKDMTQLFAAYVFPVKGNIVEIAKGVKVENPTISNGKMTVNGMDGDWVVRFYGEFPSSVNGMMMRMDGQYGGAKLYPNLLNKDAVQRFIEVTHQQYKDKITNFAGIVEAFFTDEPSLWTTRIMDDAYPDMDYPLIPYEESIPQLFKERYGYDLESVLPSLFSGATKEDMRVRTNYYELVGDMMAENYIGQIASWCATNGANASGHMLLEEGLNYQVPLYGDLMKTFEAMDYPGFDVLNMIPEKFISGTLIGAKYASSTARWQGKDKVMFELCPVVDQETFDKNAFEYGMGTLTFCYFAGGNQFTSYFGLINNSGTKGKAFNDYAARMGAMLDDATMTSGIGIYVPTTAAQALYIAPDSQNVYKGNISSIDTYIRNAANMLQKNNMDFNFLSDAAIAAGSVQNSTLDINSTPYKVIIVPDAEAISIETLRKLDAFAKAGGTLIFSERLPYVATYEKDQAELEEIVSRYKDSKYSVGENNTELIQEIKKIADTKLQISENTGVQGAIYNSPYYKNNRQFFFLANTQSDEVEMKVSFEGAKGYKVYNPVDGTITESSDGTIKIAGYRGLFVEPIL